MTRQGGSVPAAPTPPTRFLTRKRAEFAALKVEIAQLDAEVNSQPWPEPPTAGG